jgi:hypothetical protein
MAATAEKRQKRFDAFLSRETHVARLNLMKKVPHH